MNDLEKYFRNNDKRLIHKWDHYFDIYDRHFSKFRNKEVVILEIGVFNGGSLQMWKSYFGDNAKIYGIDIDPRCKELEEENIEILIGSQSDREFLKKVKEIIPKIDILIDDGGHTMQQQIISYEELFEHVKDNGVYLCEDLHTSYWIEYGGGYKRRGTFIEYSKNYIDYLNAYHSKQSNFKVNNFTKSVDSIHYYDSVIVIEKKIRSKPIVLKSGVIANIDNSSLQEKEAPKSKWRIAIYSKILLQLMINLYSKAKKFISNVLSFFWKKHKFKTIIMSLVILFLSVSSLTVSDYVISNSAKPYLYYNSNEIPHRKTALLLGTSKKLKDGRLNLYFQKRIKATKELYFADKIDYIVISGDNSRIDYNEPQDIKDELMKIGIPEDVIFLDYAGFRTYDSMVRMNKIFGQNNFTVISQQFHNERAVYIGRSLGYNVIGYNAEDLNLYFGLKTQIREKFARINTFIDLLIGKEPKFLGKKINIP